MAADLPFRAYVAKGRDGRVRPWTMAPNRTDCMRRATASMMSAREYDALETTSERWKHCYRNGCRIVRATLTIKEPK